MINVGISIDDQEAEFYAVRYGKTIGIIRYTFCFDDLKRRLLFKLIEIDGIHKNDFTQYVGLWSINCKLSEEVFDTLYWLQRDIEDKVFRKAIQKFVEGYMNMEEFRRDFIAYRVAKELSEGDAGDGRVFC